MNAARVLEIARRREVARRARADEVAERRNREAACALDFRVYGDGEPSRAFGHDVRPIAHAERCVCDEPCSRTYDPRSLDSMEPDPADWYVGTGIGALYGIGGVEPLTSIDGWTIGRPA